MLKHWIATLIVGASLAGTAPRAFADGKNEIRAVSFDDDSGTTRIHVKGAQTPTFTVYKLERPSRIVIDLPQAKLADVLRGHESASTFTPGTWAVSTIAAQQLDDGGQVVRVIVTLARPGRYDVKTEGNEIVVVVTARDAAPKVISPDDLVKAQADGAQARKDATAAQAKADAAQRAADEAMKQGAASAQQIDAAKAEAMRAKQDAAKANAAAIAATADAKGAAERATQAKADAARQVADASRATQVAAQEAQKAHEDAARAKQTADAAMLAIAQEKKDAADAKLAAAQENERVKVKARAEADAAKADAATTKQLAQADAAKARAEADAAKADAAKLRAEAAAEKRLAEADKHKAEAARAEAERLMRDAKSELSQLDKKTAAAQQLEDKARATHAAALAREEAARVEADKAASDRLAAESAAKRAADARDRSSTQERDKLAAEARAAEARLASARKLTEEAEGRRATAEAAQAKAKAELETSKSALVAVEHQRTSTETAAAEASRKRSEAEAAARDASRRRSEAETAAAVASKQRGEAESAAKVARDAKDAADQQRLVAETAAKSANDSKVKAEGSLAQLNAKRDAAEKAAQDVETRSRAAAKAQAELAAATARKAGDAELAKAKAELARLETDRKDAEAALADRRRAVAAQQGEADRLKVAAVAAHDAAQREETRRGQLAALRATEEAKVVVKATAQISAIDFRGADLSGDIVIAVGSGANVELGEVTSNRIELIVDHAQLAAQLERKLDVSKFGSPIRSVSSFRDRKNPDRVRLVAELASPMTATLDRDAKSIRWHLAGQVAQAKHVAPAPVVVGGFGAASTPVAQQSVSQVPGRRHVYHGQTVSFDINNAPLHDLLRLIAETGRINIVVPDTITANVTVKLNRVPWDQALEVILSSHGLWYRKEGNLYRIATRKEIDTEDKEEAERRAAAVAAESPRPEILRLNYASANDLKGKLESMLSPKGKIEVEDRNNALIVNDVSGNREQIARLALQLDTQTPQISIEARIVEARSTFTREFGIQWGGKALSGASTGNATGLSFPSSVGLVGANTDTNTIGTGVASPSDFAVNLPAATGSGEGGAIGLSLGSVSGNFNINLRLSALEDSGTVRIVSAPKITVLNNKEAKITQGVSIPISVVSAAGAQTQFVQADLALTVKPYVSQRDCAIAMDLNVTKNEPDFVNVGARGDPSILTKTAKTSMLVLDGETSVLGGIYTRNTGLAYKKIPFLGDLPVLGWLFKDRRENDDRTEILVFITPKITNKATLHCQ